MILHWSSRVLMVTFCFACSTCIAADSHAFTTLEIAALKMEPEPPFPRKKKKRRSGLQVEHVGMQNGSSVQLLHSLLSAEEVDELLALAQRYPAIPSSTFALAPGANPSRVSASTLIPTGYWARRAHKALYDRLAQHVGIPSRHFEALQITSYASGGYYNWHRDQYLDDASPLGRSVSVAGDGSEATGFAESMRQTKIVANIWMREEPATAYRYYLNPLYLELLFMILWNGGAAATTVCLGLLLLAVRCCRRRDRGEAQTRRRGARRRGA